MPSTPSPAAAAVHLATTWRWCLPAVVFLGLLTLSGQADAYPWMMRHNYFGCGNCHADPSGGGLLTAYGRAQGDLLLRMRYGSVTTTETPNTLRV